MSPIRVAHFSDTHGFHQSIFQKYSNLASIIPMVDAWIITGDFFPNAHRGGIPQEREFQVKWFEQIWYELAKSLAGKPAIVVNGNHDFVDLAGLMKMRGYPVHAVSPEGFDFLGKRWGGFPHIPFIRGEWSKEASEQELDILVYETLKCDPDILVTHAPPYEILDEEAHYGIPSLTRALMNSKNKISHHFFGHCHHTTGQVEQLGITFVNSACRFQLVEID
jgi:Icc-related predicted phosphoesterase